MALEKLHDRQIEQVRAPENTNTVRFKFNDFTKFHNFFTPVKVIDVALLSFKAADARKRLTSGCGQGGLAAITEARLRISGPADHLAVVPHS